MFNPGNHILITGSHRSGTTWVGRTISQHSKVEYLHEPFNVDHPNPRLGLKLNIWFTHYESSDQKEYIRATFDKFLKANSFSYILNLSKPMDRRFINLLRYPNDLILKTLFRPRVLIKDPIALLSAGWLHEMYNLQVVCMIRNPLAFVGSLKKAGWDFRFENLLRQKELMQGCLASFAGEIEKLSDYRGDFIDRASLLWNVLHYCIAEYQKKYPSWLFIRYEDIAMNPIQEFEKIFHYLELEMNENIGHYIAKYTSDKNKTETEVTSYGPRDSKASLETWKTRLTSVECDRIDKATRDIAALFYEAE